MLNILIKILFFQSSDELPLFLEASMGRGFWAWSVLVALSLDRSHVFWNCQTLRMPPTRS